MSDTKTALPRDQDSNPIQVLSPYPAGTAHLTTSTTTARVGIPAGTQVVRLATIQPLYVEFGISSVAATTSSSSSFFMPANGVEVFRVPDAATHIAGISPSGASAGDLTITRLV